MKIFRILVVSDLHMHDQPLSAVSLPSRLTSDPDYQSSILNPLKGAVELLKEKKEKIDWLLCPGDLGDKADVKSQAAAWQELERLRLESGARRLMSTAGNHDVDSRGLTSATSPTESLRNLSPLFPLRESALRDHYWTKHFTVFRDKKFGVKLVIVNSCMFHDHKDPVLNKLERERGRISETSLSDLKRELGASPGKINLLMLHHHIRRHPFALNDNSHAYNGLKLLEFLGETGLNWLVIHGHQHSPDLRYSEGGETAPLVFSAGSVAATTWPMRGVTPRNQLYLLELPVPEGAIEPGALKGTIHSWDWIEYTGWVPASHNSGLPRYCGFGYRGGNVSLIMELKNALSQAPARRLRWPEASALIPSLNYLIPRDMNLFLELVKHEGITVDYDIYGFPSLFEARTV